MDVTDAIHEKKIVTLTFKVIIHQRNTNTLCHASSLIYILYIYQAVYIYLLHTPGTMRQ